MDVNRKSFFGLRALLLSTLVCFTQASFAMGLGNIRVTSSLNEPLSAVVPIYKDASEANISATDLTISLANPDLHRNAGLPYPSILSDLRFNITTDSNNQLQLNIYSVRTVHEPLLNFLVDLRWNRGQLVKEYSLILDPVTYTPAAISQQNNRATTSNVPTNNRPTTRRSRITSAPVVLNGDTYQVKSGDSLSLIAIAVRAQSGGNLDQIMESIYAANPDAFQNSPDRLLANVPLVIPSYYGNDVATVSSETTAQPSPPSIVEPADLSTNTPATVVAPVTTAAATQLSQPRLEILPPDQEVLAADAQAGATNQTGTAATEVTEQALNMLEQEQRRNNSLEQRNAMLENKIDDMLESNRQMQVRLDEIIQQPENAAPASNLFTYLPWLFVGLLSLMLSTLAYKRKTQPTAGFSKAAPYEAQPTSTQRMVADLDSYPALDSDSEPSYFESEDLLDEDVLIDDLATSQELYEPTNIIDADVEATQTFMGSLEDVELDAGQNLDAAQEAEIYLAYQQYKLADKTISRLMKSEPDNYKFQILKLQLLSKTGKMEELQELSVELLSRFPNRDDEVHQRIQEICDMAFSANMGAAAVNGDAAMDDHESLGEQPTIELQSSDMETDAVPEYEETKEIDTNDADATEPGLEMTALQDDITEFLNEDLTLSDTDPMLVNSIIDHEVETEINPDVEYSDISDQLTELMDDITEEGLDLPFDLETEILQEEEKSKILDKHKTLLDEDAPDEEAE